MKRPMSHFGDNRPSGGQDRSRGGPPDGPPSRLPGWEAPCAALTAFDLFPIAVALVVVAMVAAVIG